MEVFPLRVSSNVGFSKVKLLGLPENAIRPKKWKENLKFFPSRVSLNDGFAKVKLLRLSASVARNIFRNFRHLASKFRPILAKFRAFSGSFLSIFSNFWPTLLFLLHFYVTIFQNCQKKSKFFLKIFSKVFYMAISQIEMKILQK